MTRLRSSREAAYQERAVSTIRAKRYRPAGPVVVVATRPNNLAPGGFSHNPTEAPAGFGPDKRPTTLTGRPAMDGFGRAETESAPAVVKNLSLWCAEPSATPVLAPAASNIIHIKISQRRIPYPHPPGPSITPS